MGTCHQLYSEAAPLRYKNTSITHFDGYRDISIPEVSPFFPIIGSLIKNLEIRVHSEPRELGYSPSIGHHSANILRHSNALSTYCPQLLNLTYLVCISQKSKSGTACKWAEISLSAEQKQDERQVWELYEALSRAGLLSAELVEAAEEVRRAKAFHQEGGILTLNMTFGDGTESIPNALPPFFSIKLVGQDREKDGFERENMFIASLLKQLRESTGL
ncbi:hypothetical protein EJ08DRAFT_140810 [Tothia fuscella]|uniref:Uncharacterized protein n=1 Tax=Tothia fuscella TaxID=1048955 RepID=A0A9P4NU56_9PEZI|nr:hypothetical protein EJ08DRAFT_140810 [Tothia fuscella]